jgi:hypothetical protein
MKTGVNKNEVLMTDDNGLFYEKESRILIGFNYADIKYTNIVEERMINNNSFPPSQDKLDALLPLKAYLVDNGECSGLPKITQVDITKLWIHRDSGSMKCDYIIDGEKRSNSTLHRIHSMEFIRRRNADAAMSIMQKHIDRVTKLSIENEFAKGLLKHDKDLSTVLKEICKEK